MTHDNIMMTKRSKILKLLHRTKSIAYYDLEGFLHLLAKFQINDWLNFRNCHFKE